MPCRDDRDSYDSYSEREISSLKKKVDTMQKRLDMYANMLCDQCKVLDALDDDDVFTTDVKEWWRQHQIEDAKRIAKEKEEAEKKRKAAEEKARIEREKDLAEFTRLKEKLGL